MTFDRKTWSKGYKQQPCVKARNREYERRARYKRKLNLVRYLCNDEPSCMCLGLYCWHVGKCFISYVRLLHIDHINGGGTKERRMYDNPHKLYDYYLNHLDEAKEKLQVLCPNCNWMKRITNNENRRIPDALN